MTTIPEAFPRGVADPFCPDGHVLTETSDRRLLWHLEMQLRGSGSPHLREQGSALRRYLNATCQHHWHEYRSCCIPPDEGCVAPHRQCLWCHDVEWLDGETS